MIFTRKDVVGDDFLEFIDSNLPCVEIIADFERIFKILFVRSNEICEQDVVDNYGLDLKTIMTLTRMYLICKQEYRLKFITMTINSN